MNLGTAQVIQGDARHLPLEDNSVDLVVTSPPYFALRSYQDGGEHYDGQLGSEGTPAEFVAALLDVTRECVRVLKPSGSLWVNLGDKYAGGGGQWDKDERVRSMTSSARNTGTGGKTYGLRAKSLIGIPWRYALACIDDLGLILRAEVIWSKPNGLPESVTDRVRRSHEQWFHFTLEPRYFSAVDEIREAVGDYTGTRKPLAERGGLATVPGNTPNGGYAFTANPLGKLPGSVWTIPTQPLQVPDHLGIDHFAAFPTEWPKRIIQGWSPAGVCVECGEGRRPVSDRASEARRPSGAQYIGKRTRIDRNVVGANRAADVTTTHTITGYTCACREPTADTRPSTILDPFGGTGTTALVAKALGRHAITLDMSADYSRLAQWRVNDRNSLARVLGITKTDAPDPTQLDLFGEATA